MKKCPQCGIVQSRSEECEICGMIFEESKQVNQQLKHKSSKKNTYILALSVVLALSSLSAIYFFVISPHLMGRQKYPEAYKALKRIEAYLESGVNYAEHRKLIREAKYELNLISENSPLKEKLTRVYEIYNNIGDLSYYCKTGSYSVPKCYEAIIISTKLVKSLSGTLDFFSYESAYKEYDIWLAKKSSTDLSGFIRTLGSLEDSSEKYSEKARPILFTTASQILKECEP